MKRSPELKPNFWDGIVALAVIALAAAAQYRDEVLKMEELLKEKTE